jgi:hypothetical protein
MKLEPDQQNEQNQAVANSYCEDVNAIIQLIKLQTQPTPAVHKRIFSLMLLF